MKVPILRISSIPWLNMGNVELIRRFGLLQLRISSSQFGCPEALELVGLGLYYELPLGDNFMGSVRFHGTMNFHWEIISWARYASTVSVRFTSPRRC